MVRQNDRLSSVSVGLVPYLGVVDLQGKGRKER